MMLVALLACFSLCFADPAWEQYKLEFGKVYSAEEDAVRYETWKDTVAEIEIHNALYAEDEGYTQGINEFTDFTDEEFEADYLSSLEIPDDVENGTLFVPSNEPIPNSMDWRSKGYVTPVKNQGRCGSCYSFSATGALEGQWFKKTGQLVSLSEQQIVDCSTRFGNHGCHGGWYQTCWKYVQWFGGNERENDYRYTARQGSCRHSKSKIAAKVTGYHDTQRGSESDLTAALAQVGPVSVAIDASRRGFRSYRHGVFYDRSCSSYRLNHAVLAVGYGTEGGSDYYLVKNSWATRWGDNGYIKMARNRGNNCGIASRPSYPNV